MYYQQRNVVVSVILTIITCGLYGIYWYAMINDESLQTTKQYGTSGIVVILLTLITCGIYSIYWGYKIGERLDREKVNRGIYTSNNSAILYLILNLFSLDIITWILVQSDLNMLNSGNGANYEYGAR